MQLKRPTHRIHALKAKVLPSASGNGRGFGSAFRQQTKNTTGRAQTRVFAGFGALFGKEPDREQREKTGLNGPEMGTARGVPLKRPAPGTAPTLGKRAEKNPTDKGWVFR